MIKGQSRTLSVTLVFILGSLWGLHFSLIKICSESGLSALTVLTLSTIGVALAFIVISALRKSLPRCSWHHLGFYFLCALLGYSGPILIELAVAQHMEAGLLTLVVSTTPLITLAIATLLKTERVGRKGLLGVLLGSAAIFMLVIPKLNGSHSISWQILLTTFLVPLCYGIYHNYVARFWPKDSNTWQVASGEMLVALLFVLPIFLYQGGDIFPQQHWQNVHWIIVVMVVFAVLEVYLYFEIIRLAGAVTVSLSNFVTIAAGVIWGMLIFAERPSWWQWMCVALLMLALYLVLGNRQLKIKS